jgi:hypothetical protein
VRVDLDLDALAAATADGILATRTTRRAAR